MGKFREVPASALMFTEPDALIEFGEGDESNNFKLRVYSGKPLRHWLFGQVVIDLEGITFNKRLPVLLEHDPDRRAGVADSISTDGALTASGRLFKTTDAANEVRTLRDEGFPWEASGGYNSPTRIESLLEGATATVNGFAIEGPAEIWREVQLREPSFVTLGADQDTGLAASQRGGTVQIPEAVPFKEATMPKEQPEMTFDVAAEQFADDIKKLTDKAAVDANDAAVEIERARVSSLIDAFGKRAEFALEHVGLGSTVDEARAAYSDVLIKENAELQAKLDSGSKGGKFPASDGQTDGKKEGDAPDFLAASRAFAAENKVSLQDAMLHIAKINPELHAKFNA